MELKNLQRLIPSLELDDPDSPDIVIAIDGVYEGFKFKDKPTPDYSTDGSREYLQSIPKVQLDGYAGYQPDKRQLYVDLAADAHHCDVIIIIDADEYLHPDYRNWKYFRKRLDEYIQAYDPNHGGLIFRMPLYFEKQYEKAFNKVELETWVDNPRIWHRPEKLEYYNGIHYWVRHRGNKTSERLASLTIPMYEAIRLVTDTTLRSKEFLEARDNWAEYGLAKEKKLESLWDEFHGDVPSEVRQRGTSMKINPLVCCLQPRDIPEFIKAVNTQLEFVDKYWIRYHEQPAAYKAMYNFFIEHTEYSHLVILPDDLIPTREGYARLFRDLVQFDYLVISGYCNLDTKDNAHLSNISLDHLPPRNPAGKTYDDYHFNTIAELEELRDKWNNRILEVKYAGFPMTIIHRYVFMQGINFRYDNGCCPDVLFGLDIADRNIPQFVDLRVKLKHLKVSDKPSEQSLQIGKKKPQTELEYKNLLGHIL
jgi:hypothetical protein